MTELRVGLIGAGTLGRTVAHAGLAAGSPVTIVARGDRARRAAVESSVLAAVTRDVQRGRVDPAHGAAMHEALRVVGDLAELHDVDVLVESVVEDLAVKRAVFAAAEEVLRSDAVIASTTSSIPAAELAAGARHPERIVVAHYVWPAHRIALVEVACHGGTSPGATALLDRLLGAQRKRVVRVADRPGFLITRALFAYWNAALELIAAGTSPAEVDDALTAVGWPMGPAQVMQSTGLASVFRIHARVAPYLGHRFTALAALAALSPAATGFDAPTLTALRAGVRQRRADPARIVAATVGALAAEVDRAVDEGVVAGWAEAAGAIDLAYGFPPRLGPLRAWRGEPAGAAQRRTA